MLGKFGDAVDGDVSKAPSKWTLFSAGYLGRCPCLALYGGGGVPGGVTSASTALSHLSGTLRGPASSVRSIEN